jgi:hypothetical protein
MVTKDLKKTKQVVLNVANNKYPFFMELLKNFDFVQIEENQGDSEEKIIVDLTEAIEQVKLIKEGKL